MDRFHEMAVYVAVAEEAGFAAAARRLGMSPPAVTRAIAKLEERLGAKLLQRTTRFVRATEAGLRFLEDARRILSDVSVAEESAIGVNAAPRGQISVTAPQLFGRRFVLPGIAAYLERYPDTQVYAVLLDRVVNLLEEGFNVGVRIGELDDSSMRAVRVGSVRRVLCASPRYLAEHGVPSSLDSLHDRPILAFASSPGPIQWRFEQGGQSKSIRLVPRLTLTTNDAMVAAAEAGLGIARLLSYQVCEEVSQGSVAIVMEEFEPPPIPVHILHREDRLQSGKVRAFADLMAETLRNDERLNPGGFGAP